MKKVIRSIGRERRHDRIRKIVHGTADRPRLFVRVTNKHLYVQFVDDEKGSTLVSVTTCKKETPGSSAKNIAAATALGQQAAAAAKEKGIVKVVFDRGGCKFHGRVKAIAEAVRQAGIQF